MSLCVGQKLLAFKLTGLRLGGGRHIPTLPAQFVKLLIASNSLLRLKSTQLVILDAHSDIKVPLACVSFMIDCARLRRD